MLTDEEATLNWLLHQLKSDEIEEVSAWGAKHHSSWVLLQS